MSTEKTLEVLLSRMENFITTKTVVGDPLQVGDVILMPIVDVSFGLGAAGADTGSDGKTLGGNGGCLGAKIVPSAILVVQNGAVQLVNVKNQDSVNKLIDMVPGVLSKLNFGSMFNKKDSTQNEKTEFETEVYTE